MPSTLIVLTTFSVMATVVISSIAAYYLFGYALWRRRLDTRMGEWGADSEVRHLYRRSVFLQLGDWIDNTSWGKKVQSQLLQADLLLKPSEYLAILVLLWLASFFVVQLLFELSFLFSGMIAIITVIILSRFYLNSRRDHYVASFDAQMPEVATLISNSLKAGLSIHQAFQVVADKMPAPAGIEFARTNQEIRMGIDIERVMMGMLDRLPSEELRMMMTTIMIQRLAGSNLAEALSVMSSAVTARRKLKDEIRTMTAEVRFSGVLLVVLPIITLAIVNRIMPGSVVRFISHPVGWIIMTIYITVQVVAFILVRRISDIRV